MRRLGRFLGVGFFGGHRFVHPLVGSFQVSLAGVGLVALIFGAFTVQQIHVGYGIVVVGLKLKRLLQRLNPILDVMLALRPQRSTCRRVTNHFAIVQVHVVAHLDARRIGQRPVDDGHRKIIVRVVGVQLDGLHVVLASVIPALQVEAQGSNGDRASVALLVGWVILENVLELADRLGCDFGIGRRFIAGNVLLGVGIRQKRPRLGGGGIEFERSQKVLRGTLVVGE